MKYMLFILHACKQYTCSARPRSSQIVYCQMRIIHDLNVTCAIFMCKTFALVFFCTKICEKSKSTTFSTIKFNTLGYWSMPPQFDVLPAVYSLTFTERHQQNSRHQTFLLLSTDILQLCFFDMFAYCLHQHLVQGRHKCRSEVLDFADYRLQMRI